jgi:hypothetical protein
MPPVADTIEQSDAVVITGNPLAFTAPHRPTALASKGLEAAKLELFTR